MMKREIALLAVFASLGLVGLTGYDVTVAKPLLHKMTKLAQTSAVPEKNWHNCLTREVWSPEKQAWCQMVAKLKNSSYQLPGLGDSATISAQLRDGVYVNPAKSQRVSLISQPGAIALGDLNNDGKQDAVVLLAANTGGSGVFVYLTAVVTQGGIPKQAASTLLGDRVKVSSVAIGKTGRIKVDMIVQGPKDPMCCPTKAITQFYTLTKGKLLIVSGITG